MKRHTVQKIKVSNTRTTKNQQKEIFMHTDWQEIDGRFKTPIVLLYDDDHLRVTTYHNCC